MLPYPAHIGVRHARHGQQRRGVFQPGLHPLPRGIPEAGRFGARGRAHAGQLAHPVHAVGQPEEALAADHRPQALRQQARKALRMERPPRAVHEAADAVFLGLRRMHAAQRLHPARRQLRLDEIEAARVQDLMQRHVAVLGQHQPGLAIHRTQHRQRGLQYLVVDQVAFAHHDHVGKLDLLTQQVDHPAHVLGASLLATVGEAVGTAEITQELLAIHHRHQRVQAGDVIEAEALLIAYREGGRHRHRLGDAGGLDQQVVIAPLGGQPLHLLQQVLAQGAADAAVAELHQRFFGTAQRRPAIAQQLRIDVDLAHVVDDHRHPPPLAVAQHLVEQGGLAGAEETGQHGHRQAGVGGSSDGSHGRTG
ncbi:hypothetical protein D3C86_798680 [compost metagenome]